MENSWRKYQDLLINQVEEAKHNVDHAETILKQARARLNIAQNGLDQFNILLEEKLDRIQKENEK